MCVRARVCVWLLDGDRWVGRGLLFVWDSRNIFRWMKNLQCIVHGERWRENESEWMVHGKKFDLRSISSVWIAYTHTFTQHHQWSWLVVIRIAYSDIFHSSFSLVLVFHIYDSFSCAFFCSNIFFRIFCGHGSSNNCNKQCIKWVLQQLGKNQSIENKQKQK